MNWVQKAGAGLAITLFVVAAVLGFLPLTVGTTDLPTVQCGSAFISSTPTPGSGALGSVVGALSTIGTNTAEWQSTCHTARSRRLHAIVLIVAGGVAAGWIVHEVGTRKKATDAKAATDARVAAAREERWRQADWAPVEEMQGPPPGWVRVDSGGRTPD